MTDTVTFLLTTPGLLQLVTWCELLLSQHADRLGNANVAIHQALVWCLVCPYSRVRLAAQTSVRKLASSLGGSQLAAELLKTLSATISNSRIQVSKLCTSREGETALGYDVEILYSTSF